MHIIPILTKINRILYYSYDTKLDIGTFVKVYINKKLYIGIVWISDEIYEKNLRKITKVLPYQLDKITIAWLQEIANWNMLSITKLLLECMQPKGSKVYPIYYIHNNYVVSLQELTAKLPTTPISNIHEYIQQNLEHTLSVDQLNAIEQLRLRDKFSVDVLQGYTGSGKTYVFFDKIQQVLTGGGQVLLLLPEIALTKEFQKKCKQYFGIAPLLYSSNISISQRQSIYDAVYNKQTCIVIGSRSAIWLPFGNLQYIVIDEEHDSSYKQENNLTYHCKEVAILRAKYYNIPITLVSATPSLETISNIESNSYTLLQLTRSGTRNVPIQLVQTNNLLSKELRDAIHACLEKKEQVLLFLNKRGFANHIFCNQCKEKLFCDRCSCTLIYHLNGITHCSACNIKRHLPKVCKKCLQSEWRFFGIGIERIEHSIRNHFSNARIAMCSSDVSSEQLQDTLTKFSEQKIDILIGTQILAKGYNFTNLTLVGIQIEIGWESGDPRYIEKIYQLLAQVKGRCGRSGQPSKVIIQSKKMHSLLTLLKQNQIDKWIQEELQFRKDNYMPPYFHFIRIILSADNPTIVEDAANKLASAPCDFKFLGPAPNIMYKRKRQYRWSFLIIFNKNEYLQNKIRNWIDSVQFDKSILVSINVNPYVFT